MRYIKIPDPITCVDPFTKDIVPGVPTTSFAEFMVKFVLPGITGSREKWNKANELEALILGAKDGVLAIRESDWDVLAKACEAPQLQGNSVRQLVPFLNAVCGADTQTPVEVVGDERSAAGPG